MSWRMMVTLGYQGSLHVRRVFQRAVGTGVNWPDRKDGRKNDRLVYVKKLRLSRLVRVAIPSKREKPLFLPILHPKLDA